MTWTAYKGNFDIEWYPKTASTLLASGGVVALSSGQLIAATTTTANVGVSMKSTASTDTDYASTTLIPVQLPRTPTSTWKVDVLSTDTAVATDAGAYYMINGSTGLLVTRASVTHDNFLVQGVLSANVVTGYLNSVSTMYPNT